MAMTLETVRESNDNAVRDLYLNDLLTRTLDDEDENEEVDNA